MRAGVPIMLSLIIGAAATPGGTEELPGACAGNRAGPLTAQEVHGCAQERFELARGAADGLTERQFRAAWPAADGLRHQFARADRDGDGWISRDEWVAWFGPAYADAPKAREGEPSGTD